MERFGRVWDAATGKVIKRLTSHTADVLHLEFDTSGKKLVSSSWDGSAILWNPESGERIRTFVNSEILQRFGGGNNSVWSASISPNGSMVATGSEDGAVRLWNVATGLAQAIPRGHQGAVKDVSFSPDGKQIVSAGLDGNVRIWDTDRTRTGLSLPIKLGMYSQITYRPDGGSLALASGPVPVKEQPGRILFLYPTTGEPNTILAERKEGFRSIAFDPDSQILAANYGTSVRIWDAQTGHHLRDLEGGSAVVNSVSATTDQLVIAGDQAGMVRCWSARSGDLTASIQTELTSIEYLAAHRNGTVWAAVGPDGQIVISKKRSRGNWSVPKAIKAMINPLANSSELDATLAFSPTDQVLAVGFGSGVIELWNTDNETLSHKVEGHVGQVKSLCFSADGNRLASGGKDGTVVLWDTASGQEALVLRKQLRYVSGVAFSPDSNSLAALEELAEKVVIWNTSAAKP